MPVSKRRKRKHTGPTPAKQVDQDKPTLDVQAIALEQMFNQMMAENAYLKQSQQLLIKMVMALILHTSDEEEITFPQDLMVQEDWIGINSEELEESNEFKVTLRAAPSE